MKKVIIRADASTTIGSGHVIRCLTVAHALRQQGVQVCFWMKELPGHLIDYVTKEGFDNISSSEFADLYIVDHYELDVAWESEHRTFAKKIMVIDDLANRKHDCDVLLDQNVVPHFASRYDNLVPKHCVKLLGPQYLMMRHEFIEARQSIKAYTPTVERLLVFMGGSDPTHETMKVLQALQHFTFSHVDIVVGNGNTRKQQIQEICESSGYHYYQQINYMAQLMQQADFCLGAGGSTMWERCYVGLPSSSTIVADNQVISTNYAAELGAVWNLGWHKEVFEGSYRDLLQAVQNGDINRKQLRDVGLDLTASQTPNAWLSKIMEVFA